MNRSVDRPFSQVDVFTDTPLLGNPLAVVHDADGLDDERMQAFARWTNLSETSFLAAPTEAGADYRVRIFTPDGELPFAGHPTLGSCHAWLEAGGAPKSADEVVQQCGVGLVRVRRSDGRLAFAAPPLDAGPVRAEQVDELAAALGIDPSRVVDSQWLRNGPNWLGLLLASAADVLAVEPDAQRMKSFEKVGVIGPVGPRPAAAPGSSAAPAFEVRGFVSGRMVYEDPVTGSLNAGFAQWLIGSGRAPAAYVAAQGTRLGRAGRVHVARDADATIWIGGDCITCVHGSVTL